MPPKSAPLIQAAVWRIIKESVDAAIAAERARHVNAGNDARGSGPVRGHDAAPVVRECTFAGFMKCNPTIFCVIKGAVELRRWFEKTESVFGISECAEGKKSFCPVEEIQRMEHKLWNLRVKEYNIVAYTQRFNELALMYPRMVKPESMKVDAYIRGLSENIKGMKGFWKKRRESGNGSGKNNHKDNSRQSSQNSQKQGNARAMITAPIEGKVSFGSLPVCECANAQPVWTCYDSGEQGHKRNRCPKKVKQEETGSFMDTRFSSVLDIDPVKIDASYEVELADGRVVSTNIVLKGCTLNLVNHLFKINLMLIELGTFDVIISMDWLVKRDAVIVCGEKVVCIPYGNKTLIVESDKGISRLKFISCIKARKYSERGCHLFLAHVTEKILKEKRLEDVPVIRDFPEVFPDDFPVLPPPRQVEFRIDLVLGATLVARAPYRLAPSKMRELSVQLQELLEK
ncbi:putative reverse transcriptase domain-containing protein [Tanacetum coccineum]|uniref:Reverse transcriptase domain-containing protein n=1 Tax=Tanacetum coccineum TaxID=301880 RepID=A0ABQ4Z576_9ASTR